MSRLAAATIDFLMLIESHFAKSARAGLLVSAVRLRVISSHNREVGHVPAYSYSNRWVGVGRARSDAGLSLAKFLGAAVTVIIVEEPVPTGWWSVAENG